MTTANDPAIVWDLIKKIGVSMFVTRDGEALEGRPLQSYCEPEHGVVVYMTDSTHVLSQIEQDNRVLLSFADKGGNDYVAIDGTAVVSNDRAKIKELWTVWAEAFWESPEDPGIRIITVTPHKARYWDGPNALAISFALIVAAATGSKPVLGTSGDVSL